MIAGQQCKIQVLGNNVGLVGLFLKGYKFPQYNAMRFEAPNDTEGLCM